MGEAQDILHELSNLLKRVGFGRRLRGLQDVMRVSLWNHDLTLIGCHIYVGMLLYVLDWCSVSTSFGFHFVDCRVKKGSFLLIPSQEG